MMDYVTEMVKKVQKRIDDQRTKINETYDEYSKAFNSVRDYNELKKERDRLEGILEGIQSLCDHEYEFDGYDHRETYYKCKIWGFLY